MKMLLLFFLICATTYPGGSDGLLINFDGFSHTPELVRKFNYPLETHQVVTDDGYILTHHRIPHGIRKQSTSGASKSLPVIVQHGLCGSSADWLLFGPSKSLGFILADQGYDVWLVNSRGNTYSMKHQVLSHRTPTFWDFSWHEMGVYDLPNTIDYILNVTRSKEVVHIGHSQGTTTFYVMMSLKGSQFGPKVRLHISYSPVVYIMHADTLPWLLIKPLEQLKRFRNKYLRSFNFAPSNILRTAFLSSTCSNSSPFRVICEYLYYLIMGYNPVELNVQRLGDIFAKFPESASMKQNSHFVQSMVTGMFAQYNYYEDNVAIYGTDTPPLYNLTAVTTPVHVFYGDRDAFAHVEDVDLFLSQLPNVAGSFPVADFAHYDFLYGNNAIEKVYKRTLQILKQNALDNV